MLKRVGVLAFVLTAGALFQPVAALAAERGHDGNRVESRQTRVVEQYRQPVRGEDWNGAGVVRRDDRDFRGQERVVVTAQPSYWYTAAPNCAYGR